MKLWGMKPLILLALLTIGAAPVDHPWTFLLSIERLPLKGNETLAGFTIKTWGVTFRTVCKIPAGWRITAGGSATPEGELTGEGGQGSTWLNVARAAALRDLVLVTLDAPIQRQSIGSDNNGVPATFQGAATINSDDGDRQRVLDYKNIRLMPANRCRNR